MLDFSQEGIHELMPRFRIAYLAIGALLLFVIFRLAFLQVIRGDFFWLLSSEHAVKEIRIPAPRGIFYDRSMIPFVESRPSYDLALIPQYTVDREAVKRSLAALAGLKPEIFEETWKKAATLPSFYPITILSDIPYELAARLKVKKMIAQGEQDPWDLRGTEILARPLRKYHFGTSAAPLFGYLGEISEKTLARFQEEAPNRYFPGDLVGASGLEKYWETILKGQDGYQQKIVDAAGREIAGGEVSSLLESRLPESGSGLVLTLDHSLQVFAEEQFRGKAGGLVALDVQNGDILAWVSLPTFDPARLMVNVDPKYWNELITDPEKPFLNKPLQSYPPGSTFKIVTGLAALEEKVVTPTSRIHCVGGLRFGSRFFRCWQKSGHGAVDLTRAVVESCDTFFYQMGSRLGVDRMAHYATGLGLGEPTGIDLPEEKGGLIPTTAWKRRLFKEEWQPGENLSVAVGQGAVLVTPLQNALMVAAVANEGRRLQPRLVQKILSPTGEEKRMEPEIPQEVPISDESLRRLREAMGGVVANPAGTAHGSRSAIVSIGGKTGTAQVISEEGRQRAGGGVELRDHAWFIAFAPVENPRIAVSVLVEHGGFGASAAAPIAKAVIEKYFNLIETDEGDQGESGISP